MVNTTQDRFQMAHSQCPWLLLNDIHSAQSPPPINKTKDEAYYISQSVISGKAPLYSCPTLDLSEDTNVCWTKCIDVPSWQHKTSNKHQTTVSSLPYCMLLYCMFLLLKCELIKWIIYTDISWKHIATWATAFSDLDLSHCHLNLFVLIDLNRK